MANKEACELYIEQEIEEGLKQGKTPYFIGQELAKWVSKLFETQIKPSTIESRARRNPSFEGKKSQLPEINTDIIKNRQRQGGGKREGAGRPLKNQLIIELNKKIGELYRKEEEYRELEKKFWENQKNNPEHQTTTIWAIILGALIIIEKKIELSEQKKTATYIPPNKRKEIINRWDKIQKFINEKIEMAGMR